MNMATASAPMDSYWKSFLELQSLPPGGVRRSKSVELQRVRFRMVSSHAQRMLIEMVEQPESGTAWQLWFWFNHFNVLAYKAQIAPVLGSYTHGAIVRNLGGLFSDLLTAVTLHPAMLMYLDNSRNVKGQGNENHARELLELHTLGVGGGYTQADVAAAAEIMTGWGVRLRGGVGSLGETVFQPSQHESGSKVVLGHTFGAAGEAELPELLGYLAKQPATARRVCRRLAVWMLSDEPSASDLESLEAVFHVSKGHLPTLWSEAWQLRKRGREERGVQRIGKFKDPVRFVTSAVRLLAHGAPIENGAPLERWLRQLGQPLFLRGAPDGYPLAGREWLNAGQLTQRVELARDMVMTLPRMLGMGAGRSPLASSPLESRLAADAVGRLSSRSRAVVGKAATPSEAWALLLASPEFMYF